MAFGIGKGTILPLLVVNFGLYFISAALAGSILNRNLDSNAHLNNEVQIGESSSFFYAYVYIFIASLHHLFLFFSFISRVACGVLQEMLRQLFSSRLH